MRVLSFINETLRGFIVEQLFRFDQLLLFKCLYWPIVGGNTGHELQDQFTLTVFPVIMCQAERKADNNNSTIYEFI